MTQAHSPSLSLSLSFSLTAHVFSSPRPPSGSCRMGRWCVFHQPQTGALDTSEGLGLQTTPRPCRRDRSPQENLKSQEILGSASSQQSLLTNDFQGEIGHGHLFVWRLKEEPCSQMKQLAKAKSDSRVVGARLFDNYSFHNTNGGCLGMEVGGVSG